MIQLNLDALTPDFADAARLALCSLQLEEGEHGIPVITEHSFEDLEVYFSNNGALVISCKNSAEFLRGLSYVKKIVEDGIPVKEKARS